MFEATIISNDKKTAGGRMNNQQKKKILAEEIWLNYFNNVLFEKKIITEDERNKMKNLISSRCDNKRKPLKLR